MSVKFHESFCLDSQQDQLLWWDDFLGDQVQDEWRLVVAGTGAGAVVDQQTGGIVRLRVPAASDSATLDWASIRSLHVSQRISIEARVLAVGGTVTNTYREPTALRFDGNNYISFYHAYGSADIYIRCVDGGVPTSADSGINIDGNYHIYRIECHTHGANHVHFYIDGTQTANSPITTNVPDDATDFLQPYLRIIANASLVAETQTDIDYVVVRQDV